MREPDTAWQRIAVIGLGHVGLPLAVALADAGHTVLGVDTDSARVRHLAAGQGTGNEPGLAERLAAVLAAGRLVLSAEPCDVGQTVHIVCVPTPVDATHRPDYSALGAALRAVAGLLRRGHLVIVESTLAPGTMARLVVPLLEAGSGLSATTEFCVAHCPERIIAGHVLHALEHMPRVVGGWTPEASERAAALYRSLHRSAVSGRIDVTDALTAEIVKAAENAERDLQIAFANGLAILCEELGADVWRVRELINHRPDRRVLEPGAGVGGPCIPKDGWLLASAGRDPGLRSLVQVARNINGYMPRYLAVLTQEILEEHGRGEGARVVVLGVAYLPGADDARNSPGLAVRDALAALGHSVTEHDPHVLGYGGDWREVVRGADAVVLVTAHEEYRQIDLREMRGLMRTPVLVDGRRFWSAEEAAWAGLDYRCIGVGREDGDQASPDPARGQGDGCAQPAGPGRRRLDE